MNKRTIKVFIASPGDLAIERRTFKDTIDELNAGFGRGANVEFRALGWEDALSTVGRRSQAVINQDVDACDVFVLAMWRRWGQEAPDAAPLSSYTEEEFFRAVARFEKTRSPAIFVFFKIVEAAQIADAGPQLARVLKFKKELEHSRTVLYRTFTDEKDFRSEIDRHLVAYSRNEIVQPENNSQTPIVPDSIVAELERLREVARKAEAELQRRKPEISGNEGTEAAMRLAEAELSSRAVENAKRAAKAAIEGRIEEARQDFAKALDGTTNLDVLSLGAAFFSGIGELAEADRLFRRWLSINGPENPTTSTAVIHNKLGEVSRQRWDLDAAESHYQKALEISSALNDLAVVADTHRYLSIIQHIRGNTARAFDSISKALAINTSLARREHVADDLCHLGLIQQDVGKFAEADRCFAEAIEINESISRLDGLAAAHFRMGRLEQAKGELVSSKRHHQKALEIETSLSNREGMARNLSELGLVDQSLGDHDGAASWHSQALSVHESLGQQDGVAEDYDHLGVVEQAKGNLDAAESHHKKALAIDERSKRLDGIANACVNLGVIAQTRGHFDRAIQYHQRALETNKQIQRHVGMGIAYANLGIIAYKQGDYQGAQENWSNAERKFARMNTHAELGQVRLWLDLLRQQGLPETEAVSNGRSPPSSAPDPAPPTQSPPACR